MSRLTIVFPARRFQIPLQDKVPEYDKVENEVNREDRQHHQPVGFGLSRQNAIKHKVNQTVGESGADANIQYMAGDKSQSRKKHMNHKQSRSQE